MDQNPEGTKNPLNPGADSNAGATLGASPSGATPTATVENVAPATEAPAPVETATPVATEPVAAEPVAAVPVVDAPVVDAPKKKTGLIVGLIVGLVVIIGGVVAALLLIPKGGGDSVTRAVKKLLSGSAPAVVAVDGTVDFAIDLDESPIKNVSVAIKSNISSENFKNSTIANVGFALDGEEYAFGVNEMMTDGGDLYVKVDGVTSILEDSNLLDYIFGTTSKLEDCDEEDGDDCSDYSPAYSSQYDAIRSTILDIAEEVDGVWFKISASDINSVTGGAKVGSAYECLEDSVKGLKNNSVLSNTYDKYPFVTYTSENVKISSKKNTVFKTGLDADKFGGYVDEVISSGAFDEVFKCMGTSSTVSGVDRDAIAELSSMLPAVYTEIDENDNFSRFYTVVEPEGSVGKVTVDLGFTYPNSVNISEPSEYTTIQEFMTSLQEKFESGI